MTESNTNLYLPQQGHPPAYLQELLMGRLDEFGTALGTAYNTLKGINPSHADGILESGMAPDGSLTIAMRQLEEAADRINRYVKRAAYAAEVESAKAKLKLAEDRYAEVAKPGSPGSS